MTKASIASSNILVPRKAGLTPYQQQQQRRRQRLLVANLESTRLVLKIAQEIKLLNRRAISFWLDDHHHKDRIARAMDCWHQALHHLSQLFQTIMPNKPPPQFTTSTSRLVRLQGPALRDPEQTVSPEAAFVFMPHWFVMSSLPHGIGEATPTSTSSRYSEDWHTLQGMILYNLAYAYHQQGQPAVAIPYYQRALKCKTRHKTLALAALNNLGHAHSLLFQCQSVRACQGLLWKRRQDFHGLVKTSEYCLAFQRLDCAPVA